MNTGCVALRPNYDYPFSACVVPSVSNATADTTSTIAFNTSVTYTCYIGYSHTGGQLTRTCEADGQLSGSIPECTSKFQRSDCDYS